MGSEYIYKMLTVETVVWPSITNQISDNYCN